MPTLYSSIKNTENPPSSSLSVKPNFSYATKAILRNAQKQINDSQRYNLDLEMKYMIVNN